MTTLISSPTTVTVQPPSTTVLGVLAGSMSPGSWARLTLANDQNAILGVGSVSGSTIHYSNSMPWNPAVRCIEIIGADHNYGRARHMRYDEATNAFFLASDNATAETLVHGYDHTTVNPTTGDVYHRDYYTSHIERMARGIGSFSVQTSFNDHGFNQVAIGTCWWSGNLVGAGNQGALLVFNSGNSLGKATDGQLTAFDPLSNKWVLDIVTGATPFAGGAYHVVAEYSAVKNVAVYGGGNLAPTKLFRLSADGSITAMPTVPTGKAVGIQAGNFVADPVTGNFLLLSAGELWELNPGGGGSWTQQTGGRTPPGAVGIPGPGSVKIDGVISCAIPQYGVIAYVTQTSSTGGSFFLYKHA
jgi:hypothetical protein